MKKLSSAPTASHLDNSVPAQFVDEDMEGSAEDILILLMMHWLTLKPLLELVRLQAEMFLKNPE